MGSERGFVSVRLFVLLGLVVAAVWAVPLTLLQSDATHPADVRRPDGRRLDRDRRARRRGGRGESRERPRLRPDP